MASIVSGSDLRLRHKIANTEHPGLALTTKFCPIEAERHRH